MKPIQAVILQWLLAMALVVVLLMSGEAGAAPPVATESGPIACKVGSPVYSATYSPFVAGNHVTTMSVEVTCSRSTDLIASTVKYEISSFNGDHPSGGGNRAAIADTPPKYIKYDLYLDSNCSVVWKGGTNRIINTALLLPAGVTSASALHTFYACIPEQPTVIFGNGYSDTVKLVIANVKGSPGTPNMSNQTDGLLQVSINVPKICNISTKPGPVAFGNYVAFGPAKTASSSFGVTCSSATPYDMSITDSNDRPIPTDGISGVIAGLGYKLTLSETSGTGTGAEKRHQINGTMAAKQPGSCANGGCIGEQKNIHKLVVTY